MRLLATALLLGTSITAANAATIVAYAPSNGTSVAPSIEATAVTGSLLTRGAGLAQNPGASFNSRGWDQVDAVTALAAGDYLSWGFSSTEEYDLTSLDIRYDRSPTGPAGIDLLVSVNGGSLVSVFTDNNVSTRGEEAAGIDLGAFDDVFSANFFLTGFGATTTRGTFDLENTLAFDGANGLVLSGNLSAVPVPAALPMMLSALAVVGIARRRRVRAS